MYVHFTTSDHTFDTLEIQILDRSPDRNTRISQFHPFLSSLLPWIFVGMMMATAAVGSSQWRLHLAFVLSALNHLVLCEAQVPPFIAINMAQAPFQLTVNLPGENIEAEQVPIADIRRACRSSYSASYAHSSHCHLIWYIGGW